MDEKQRKEAIAKGKELLKHILQVRVDNLIEFFTEPVTEEHHILNNLFQKDLIRYMPEQERNSFKFFLPPNPKQQELLKVWEDPKYKIGTFTGGNRSGKTSIGAIIAISTVIGEWPWSKVKLPITHNSPRKVRIVGQDWEKHISTVVIPALKKWWPKNRPVETRKNNMGVEAIWRDEISGGTIEIMSNKQESDLHEGWEGDLIYYDEPPKRDIRVANARGLVDRGGRELFCMTLLKEAWVDREVIKARNEDGTPDASVYNVHCTTYDNVGFGLTQDNITQFAKTLTAEEKSARLDGVPSYMSGLVYPDFRRETHLKKRFKIPLDWIVDIAIDIHPRERQAVLFTATSPRNERYICDEIWEHGDGTAIAEEIIRYIKRNVYRVGRIIIDPLSKGDKNNENTVFDKVLSVLMAHGYSLEVATKDKTAGILLIKEHLKGPNNEPSLWVFDDLKRTVFEFEGYMYDEESQKPQDKDDHMMENLYRTLLLDTKWFTLDDEEYKDDKKDRKRNPKTGY